MSERTTLSHRREAWTVNFQHANGIEYVVSYSCFSMLKGGALAEIFVNTNGKVGSEADVMVSDGATAISLALQYGVPTEVLQHAMKRNADGSAMGALGHALDIAVKDLTSKNKELETV